jgi:hypothetical protein
MLRVLGSAGGRVFRVRFIKRTTGEIRDLVGRLGVTKGVTGVGMKYDPADKGLMTVYDFQKKAFRMINLETIQEIQFKGRIFKIKV